MSLIELVTKKQPVVTVNETIEEAEKRVENILDRMSPTARRVHEIGLDGFDPWTKIEILSPLTNAGTGIYGLFWDMPEVSILMAKLDRTTDEAEREEIWKEIKFRDPHGKHGRPIVQSTVSKGYEEHTNEMVAMAMAAVAEVFGEMPEQIRMNWKDGHLVEMGPSKETRRNLGTDNDACYTRAVIQGKLGGTGSYSLLIGIFRELCSNLQMTRSLGSHKVNIRHSLKIHEIFDDMIQQLLKMAVWQGSMAERIERMQAITMNAEHIESSIRQAFGAKKDPSTQAQNAMASIFTRIIQEHAVLRGFADKLPEAGSEGFADSLESIQADGSDSWLFLNAVQWHAQHQATTRGPNATNAIWQGIKSNTAPTTKIADDIVLELLKADAQNNS